MTIFWQNIGISLVIVIGGVSTASAQSATVKLKMLVETSARRLTLARQIAFAKWDARSHVEDAAREADVMTAAVKAGQSRGLDRDFVSNFFKAQIEANKLVQYSLLATWHRAGSAPFHPAINLTTVRARLDRLQEDLIIELADTAALRTGTACQADTARAVGRYIAIHKLDDPLMVMALGRAMAATCIPSLPADSSNEEPQNSRPFLGALMFWCKAGKASLPQSGDVVAAMRVTDLCFGDFLVISLRKEAWSLIEPPTFMVRLWSTNPFQPLLKALLGATTMPRRFDDLP